MVTLLQIPGLKTLVVPFMIRLLGTLILFLLPTESLLVAFLLTLIPPPLVPRVPFRLQGLKCRTTPMILVGVWKMSVTPRNRKPSTKLCSIILWVRTCSGMSSIRLVLSLITRFLLLLLQMGKKPSNRWTRCLCALMLLLLCVALLHRLPVNRLKTASACVGLKLKMQVPLPCVQPLLFRLNRYGPRSWKVVRTHSVGSVTPESTSMVAYLGMAMFAASRLIERATASLRLPTVWCIPLSDPLPLLLVLTPLLLVVSIILQLPKMGRVRSPPVRVWVELMWPST